MNKKDMREQALDRIRFNIEKYGYHVYVVDSGTVPRFAYTIGLSEVVGFELAMPGASWFDLDQIRSIVQYSGDALRGTPLLNDVEVRSLGRFAFRTAHPTWVQRLMLGARDYYGRAVTARQIVPDAEHLTIDVPDMSNPYEERNEPIWCWLSIEWPYAIKGETNAFTDVATLQGSQVRAIHHSEENDWEFVSSATHELEMELARVVPVATLIGFDPTLLPALSLAPGSSLWRSKDGWRLWSDGPGSSDALFEPVTSRS